MNLPNAFVDDAAEAAMSQRFPIYGGAPEPNYGTGGSSCASNSPGIGIGTDNPKLQEALMAPDNGAALSGTGSWTLLDQHGNARAGQIGQLIGGNGNVIREGDVATTWDTTQPSYTPSGAASSGGLQGTLPDSTIRLWTNPDNIDVPEDSRPDPLGVPVGLGNATLTDLDVGWTAA